MKIPNQINYRIRCWQCGTIQDLAAEVLGADEVPGNGDISMCMECGNFGIFDDTREEGARKPNPSENFDISRDKDLLKIKAIWCVAVQQRQRR